MKNLLPFFLHSRALVIIIGLVLSGCASKAPPPLDMTQLPKAAQTVLEEAVYYTSLFSICARLGGDAELDALSKQQDWLAANWNLVAAADAIYTQTYSSQSFNYNSKPLLPQALRLKQKAHTKAEEELKLSTRTPGNQQKFCQFRLSRITPQNIHLIHIPLVATYEQALLSNAPAHSTQVGDIPGLAASIATDVPPGKTHFRVKQQHDRECDNAYTQILANDWPNEAYANFCGEELIQTLICEWGNCQPQ